LPIIKTIIVFLNSLFKKLFFKFFYFYLLLKKISQQKTLFNQRKIWLGFQKNIFLENLDGKHFFEVVKNLEISYYLLIILNFILKLLIAIYILF